MTEAHPSFALRLRTIEDFNDGPLLPPKPLIWVSLETFRHIQAWAMPSRYTQGHYIILKGPLGETFARVVSAQNSASLALGECLASSVTTFNLFHVPVIHGASVSVLRVPSTKLGTAAKVRISIAPFIYHKAHISHFHSSSSDLHEAGNSYASLTPGYDRIQHPKLDTKFLAGILLPSTVVFPSNFFIVNWFNRLDLIKVIDCEPDLSTLSPASQDSSLDGLLSPLLLKESTHISVEEWTDAFATPYQASADSTQTPIEASSSTGMAQAPSPPRFSGFNKEELKERIKEKVGGLDSIVEELVNLTYATVLKRSSKHRPSTVLPRGFLFIGSSGTGKTHLASTFAQHCGLKPVMVNAPDIFQSGEGQSELALTRIFEEARYAPSVIVIDELESIASNRKIMGGAIEKRLLAHFLQLLDIFNENSPDSVVIGIASSISALDPAVVRSKRLEKTFYLPIPSPQARLEILRLATAKFPKCDVDLLAHRTHGFTGSDLSNLCRQAMMLFLKQSSGSEGQTDIFNFSFFESALSVVKASALSAYSTSVPNTSFDELRGISDVVATLKSSILAPFEQQKRFELLGARPPAGVLLYGPSGVGKSKLAMAIASTAKINFLTVNSTELISKVVGQSEQALAQVFKAARAASPCILFLDQVESIARARGSDSTEEQSSDRILSLLLTEMDGIHKSTSESTGHLIVLAATNKPHMLDSAVLRPGRFDHVLFVPPPDLEARKDILDLLASKTPCSDVQPSQWAELAKLTRGYSGADLESLFREASYLALRADINAEKVTWNDLLAALNTVPASLIRAPITHPYNSQAGFVFLK